MCLRTSASFGDLLKAVTGEANSSDEAARGWHWARLVSCARRGEPSNLSCTGRAKTAHAARRSSSSPRKEQTALDNVLHTMGMIGEVLPGCRDQVLRGVLQLTFTDEEETVSYVVDGPRREVRRGGAPGADATIIMSPQVFTVLAKPASAARTKACMAAYMSGRLRVRGDPKLAMEFGELAEAILRDYSAA